MRVKEWQRGKMAQDVRRYTSIVAGRKKWVRAAARKRLGGRLAGQPQALLAPARPGKKRKP